MSRQLLITLGTVALVGGILIAVFGAKFAPNIVTGLVALGMVVWAKTRGKKDKDTAQADWWSNFR
jgi:hypothetical protein